MAPHTRLQFYCKCENNLQVKNTTVAILIKNAWLEMVFIAKQIFNSL